MSPQDLRSRPNGFSQPLPASRSSPHVVLWGRCIGECRFADRGHPDVGVQASPFIATLNGCLPPDSPDLYDSAFQQLVQSYFDSRSGLPPPGHNEEYSTYFEAYLPDERDRRRFLDGRLQACKPSYGHLCFAALMSVGRVRLIWTTNFDQLVEKACSYAVISEKLARSLAVAGLDQPDKVSDLIRDEAWPLLVKLHGDFLYRKLKNTTPELKTQDSTLRRHLAEECGRCGLAVVGYSGRDASVMSTLAEALQTQAPFPHGLFWFIRPGEQPVPAVQDLIVRVREAGAQAAFVEVNTFDELMADLFLPHQDSLADVRDLVKAARPKRQAIPISYQLSDGMARLENECS